MRKFPKNIKKTMVSFSLIAVSLCIIVVFQNCGSVHLNPIGTDTAQCVLPEDLDQYSIALFQQTATSDSFQIVDSQGQPTQISGDWNDGTDQGDHEMLTENFSAGSACTTKTITVTFAICSVTKILTQTVTIGANCTPIVVPPPPPPATACPATIPSDLSNPSSTLLTRQTRAGLSYWWPSDQWLQNVDVTDWNNVWGRFHAADPITVWPGASDSEPGFTNGVYSDASTGASFNRTSYMALKFHVPAVSTQIAGTYDDPNAVWTGGPPITASLSTSCGNFSNLAPACIVTNWQSGDNPGLSWVVQGPAGGQQNSSKCYLQPNTDYYLNIKLVNPAVVDTRCNSTACRVGLDHRH